LDEIFLASATLFFVKVATELVLPVKIRTTFLKLENVQTAQGESPSCARVFLNNSVHRTIRV